MFLICVERVFRGGLLSICSVYCLWSLVATLRLFVLGKEETNKHKHFGHFGGRCSGQTSLRDKRAVS